MCEGVTAIWTCCLDRMKRELWVRRTSAERFAFIFTIFSPLIPSYHVIGKPRMVPGSISIVCCPSSGLHYLPSLYSSFLSCIGMVSFDASVIVIFLPTNVGGACERVQLELVDDENGQYIKHCIIQIKIQYHLIILLFSVEPPRTTADKEYKYKSVL